MDDCVSRCDLESMDQPQEYMCYVKIVCVLINQDDNHENA